MYPIQHGPSVPYEVMVPHETRCQKNHGQTIDRIAERGGFSPSEAWAIVANLDFDFCNEGLSDGSTWKQAEQKWIEYAFRINLHYAQLEQSKALLEEARQLLVTASGAGEYGKGDDWAKRYEAWQEAVRVLGVGK